MKYLFTSLKGGVGKTAISVNFTSYINSLYVTNDLSSPSLHNVEQIESNKRRIPKHLTNIDNIVFDLGAMSTKIDPKVTHALTLFDVIVIPTRPDPRSLAATIATYDFVRHVGKPVVIIVNHVRDERKYDIACKELRKQLGNLPIFKIRETTLFDRVSIDGLEWYNNIHNIHGEYQLNKTRLAHEAIYEKIVAIGERV